MKDLLALGSPRGAATRAAGAPAARVELALKNP
jgi:hypothetical protein